MYVDIRLKDKSNDFPRISTVTGEYEGEELGEWVGERVGGLVVGPGLGAVECVCEGA